MTRLIAYLCAAWGTLAVLAWSAHPFAALALLVFALYSTIPLFVFLRRRGWAFYPSALFRLFVVRPFWYTNLLLPLVAGAGLIGLAGGAMFGAALPAGRVAALAMLAFGVVALAAGFIGSHRLVVRHVDVAIPGLAPELDGYRIAQLSDLHVGPHTSRRFLERVVRATKDLSPDVIVLTGDLVDDRAEDVPALASAIAGLDAPHGVFLIPGNHDVYAGWSAVERRLRDSVAGTVLVNDARVLRRGDASIVLVGTGDPAGRRSSAAPNVGLALRRARAIAPDGAPVIALAHNPSLWPALAKEGVALTLSGHTHWGQFAFPTCGWSLASPFLRYAMGAHRDGDALLYISPGTGYWGIPFRLGAFPEVSLITLRGAATAAVEARRARAA